MDRKRRVSIQELNPHLTCVLCSGYFIDATTIIECLHSFCRACIVKHLEGSKYCPTCDVQVHKTKPLQNIRHDPTLQDIVYKLIPGLLQNEMQSRREFWSHNLEPEAPTNSITDPMMMFSPDELLDLTLDYFNNKNSQVKQEKEIEGQIPCSRKYLRCPGAVTISHLHKLIRAKFNLRSRHLVEFFHKNELLYGHLTLIDVAYITKWRRKRPLHLMYRIVEDNHKRIKYTSTESPKDTSIYHSKNMKVEKNVESFEESSDWKEVQIQISETGVMSVTGITDDVALKTKTKSNLSLNTSEKLDNHPTIATKSDLSTLDHSKRSVAQSSQGFGSNNSDCKQETQPMLGIPTLANDKSDTESESSNKSLVGGKTKYEPTSSCCGNLGNGCDSNVNERTKDSKLMSSQTADDNLVPNPIQISSTLSEKSDIINTNRNKSKSSKTVKIPVPHSTISNANLANQRIKDHQKLETVSKKLRSLPEKFAPVMAVAPSPSIKKSTSGSMGYKTLKVPPKTWNPSITRSSYLNSKNLNSNPEPNSNSNSSPANTSKTSEKAPRFFKMRNMPRYLGNPASGVKPMYQVAGNSKTSDHGTVTKSKPVVMKIDPKTLSPIISVVTSTDKSSGPTSKTFYTSPQVPVPHLQESTKTSGTNLDLTQLLSTIPGLRDPNNVLVCGDTRTVALESANSSSHHQINDPKQISPADRLQKLSSCKSPGSGNHRSPTINPALSPSPCTTPSNILESPLVSHSPNFGLNPATINMLASSPSFLPDPSQFLFGNFPNFAPPLLRSGLHMNSSMSIGPNSGIGSTPNIIPGLGAYHPMPPSINMLFPQHRSSDRLASYPSHPPAVQRIPPTKNNSSANLGQKLHHNNNNDSSITNLSLSLKKVPHNSPKHSASECNSLAKNSNSPVLKTSDDGTKKKISNDANLTKPKSLADEFLINFQNCHQDFNVLNNNESLSKCNNNNSSSGKCTKSSKSHEIRKTEEINVVWSTGITERKLLETGVLETVDEISRKTHSKKTANDGDVYSEAKEPGDVDSVEQSKAKSPIKMPCITEDDQSYSKKTKCALANEEGSSLDLWNPVNSSDSKNVLSTETFHSSLSDTNSMQNSSSQGGNSNGIHGKRSEELLKERSAVVCDYSVERTNVTAERSNNQLEAQFKVINQELKTGS